MTHVKELQIKLGECGKDFPNKDGHLNELILMNMKTPDDLFLSMFHTSWTSRKYYCKDYCFNSFCGLLIKEHDKLLDEEKLEVKQ